MTKDYDKRISQLKEDLDKAKDQRIRAEAKLEQYNKQKQEIIDEIKSMGIEPDEIENEIQKIDTEIEELIKKVEEAMPRDLSKSI
ncbi:MAG TPA: hypothetical protein VF941_05400 [Clostridia bacterium]